MTKKVSNSPQIADMLIVDKEAFKQQVKDRIDLGENLLNTPLHSNQDFDKINSNFDTWTDYNIELLKQSFNDPNNEYMASYRDAGYTFMGDILGEVYGNPPQTLLVMINHKVNELKKLFGKIDLLRANVDFTKIQQKSVNPNNKQDVFIVHGHDELAKSKTARFIEKIGLTPIILHEQSSSGKTIIEKIEEYTNVGFGIVLYTPCDLGGVSDEPSMLKARARQNVVFEHGFLMGKIGRGNVCALVKGDIEVPNDISGVVYVNMDQEDYWQIKIAKELKGSGYNVDLNRL